MHTLGTIFLIKLRCWSTLLFRDAGHHSSGKSHPSFRPANTKGPYAAAGNPRAGLGGKSNVDCTVLLIPGLHAAAKYNTATYEANPSTGSVQLTHMAVSPYRDPAASVTSERAMYGQASSLRRYGVLHVQLLVESLSEEMTIKPSFLTFLEKVLINDNRLIGQSQPKALTPITERDDEGEDEDERARELAANRPASPTSTISGHSMATASSGSSGGVPIDVLLSVQIKPSPIRLSCMPWSNLECILSLPSVNVSLCNLSPKFHTNTSSWLDENGSISAGEFNSELGGVFLTGTVSHCSLLLAMPYSTYSGVSAPVPSGAVKRKESLYVELSSIGVSLSRQHFPTIPGRAGTFNVLVSGKKALSIFALRFNGDFICKENADEHKKKLFSSHQKFFTRWSLRDLA